jgi:hypothetical protein
MIAVKINVTKIDKAAIYVGERGKYVDLLLIENKEGPDQYGNDGFVSQGLTKERREAGERGPIIGNWRRLKTAGKAKVAQSRPAPPVGEEDQVPF